MVWIWMPTIFLFNQLTTAFSQVDTVEQFFSGVCEEKDTFYDTPTQLQAMATNNPEQCMEHCKTFDNCYLITMDGAGSCKLLGHLRGATKTSLIGASSYLRFCKKGCHTYGTAIYSHYFRNSPFSRRNPEECQELCLNDPRCIGGNYEHPLYNQQSRKPCWLYWKFDLSEDHIESRWMNWPRHCINDLNVTGDWITFGNSEYLVNKVPVRGIDAESQCHAHGDASSLIIINDFTEMKFIQSVIHQMIMSDFITNGIHTKFAITNPYSVRSTSFREECGSPIQYSKTVVLESDRGYCMASSSSTDENLYICERNFGSCYQPVSIANGRSWPSRARFPSGEMTL